jgi:hypothetical protein
MMDCHARNILMGTVTDVYPKKNALTLEDAKKGDAQWLIPRHKFIHFYRWSTNDTILQCVLRPTQVHIGV